MKSFVRLLLKPLLNPLEAEGGDYVYKKSHRIILIAVAGLFLFLASVSLFLAPSIDYLFPTLVFGIAGLVGLGVGFAGKDIAVARLWGSR